MSNSVQNLNPNQNQQNQKDANQENTGSKNNESARKVGNNTEKDEPRASGMKDEGSRSTSGDKAA